MTQHEEIWTNERILREFLGPVVRDIHKWADELVDAVREAATDENRSRLKDRLVDLQIGVAADIFSFIDGSQGPTYWPGIKLVNGETGESLSKDLRWDLARFEGEFLDAHE